MLEASKGQREEYLLSDRVDWHLGKWFQCNVRSPTLELYTMQEEFRRTYNTGGERKGEIGEFFQEDVGLK